MIDLKGLLSTYEQGAYFCELLGLPDGSSVTSKTAATIIKRLDKLNLKALKKRALAAEHELYNLGITFTVYTDSQAIDRILPFDVLPRIISAADFDIIDRGVQQRVAAINAFLKDIYHDQKILKDGVVPKELVLGNENYCKKMEGVEIPGDTYVHICGIDIVRDTDGSFKVLEDNARTPSGVSYVVENRHLMLRTFPDLLKGVGVRRVSDYGLRLYQALAEVAPAGREEDPVVVLLSPGVFNSAYFEHVFLAREMGVPLVEGSDLTAEDGVVYMKTTGGLQRVDVIYRRIGDDFLDPQAFRKDSMLGVSGLFDAYCRGNVTLANAIGTGVADDKAIYAYMPRIIKYYLDEEAILQNVPTHICGEPEGLKYTMDNIDKLVVKPVGEAGGYGVLVGPRATKAELDERRQELKDDPANYIAQPVVGLSVCPTLMSDGIEPRHVDLRPFAVTGKSTWVLPGGLTRVALNKGSLIVNSSQGGGSKDTWVLEK
ncbi:circularly permuted type 2 ATP-grasp protein [Sneathiella glossodoripedis]|uniref:circularly permuted type 2 ATP-grasp protein n=1 Tax=Sneathiella glossodoripedis TaxID=418853 RepID=UPI0004720250|nr:circularly permuted type 2 ATP-grasp protein [Sneathiella glossodoripedis]